MKSIRNIWISGMELVREVKNHPIAGWCTQKVRVYYKDGYIRIERKFSHPMYPDYARKVNWYRGTLEEAKAYSRMLRWD